MADGTEGGLAQLDIEECFNVIDAGASQDDNMANGFVRDDNGHLNAYRSLSESDVVAQAFQIISGHTQNAVINKPEQLKERFLLEFEKMSDDGVLCAWMDRDNRLICVDTIFQGDAVETPAHNREFIGYGLGAKAEKAVVAYGVSSKSSVSFDEVRHLATHINNIFSIVEIEVIDHLIVASASVFSTLRNKEL